MAPDSATSSGPTARRLVLGSQLRRLREASGISREDAGYAIRGSGSKISRLELGRVGFKERDVVDLLTLYGISDDTERESFLDLVRRSNEPGWWHRYNDLMPGWFQDYVGLEESASRIQTYEIQFVPGLLQTEGYARAVATQGRPEFTEDELDRRVRLRMQRQKLFSQPKAPRVWAVIDESVLHRPIGGREVLREQIEFLLEATSLASVTLQILPFELGRSGAEGAFTILRFAEPELPDIVYLEHLCGALYLDKPDEVEVYSKVSHRLAVDAQTPEQTRKTLKAALAQA
ncbi:Helix-turn-helix domain-containing protein [Saccharopolyspora antimicrobica]|uniref:Helix-turn-helix domain-containing protein n=2 Tax=Saccharopolyspora TaxID=1835 RepID=A0A1I5HIM0_9PSEU|nr:MULTISPECIES: helix-turn-helix transcriptional regulator [Saccharopolyspora]RKT85284.1 helix-turn-helix protein [Saccharopolyspora antimicrobica]SEG94906.1 Helix-turn-helix domain-containing protein [Saccharopolyspora kobensis]SFD61960.1 Helix-turn-helix domain-containing protein [Saccharopolyspora kobensis]SFO47890.1 Helix-turn-helix domain-containing protein [Saccharopolyspora antimicrobica]